jgi:hypothetical protein
VKPEVADPADPAVLAHNDDDDGDEPAPAGWVRYRDPSLGWSLQLPPGVSSTPQTMAGASSFSGRRGAVQIEVGVVAVPHGGNQPVAGGFDQAAAGLAKQLGAQVTESGFVDTGGERRYRVVMNAASGSAEARFYLDDEIMLIAYYGRSADWPASAAERRMFFDGVGLPSE